MITELISFIPTFFFVSTEGQRTVLGDRRPVPRLSCQEITGKIQTPQTLYRYTTVRPLTDVSKLGDSFHNSISIPNIPMSNRQELGPTFTLIGSFRNFDDFGVRLYRHLEH